MSICGIIFDLDGVLIDSGAAHRESWKRLGQELAEEVTDEAVTACFGRQSRDIVTILFGEEWSAEEVRRLSLRKEEIYRELVRGRIPVMAGATELLEYYWDNGFLMAVASSTSRENIDLALMEMGVADHFQVIVSSEDVPIGKPDPTVFLTAAERLKLAPEECMVIEDAPAGVEAANRAGMPVVAITSSHPAEKLQHATRVIQKLTDLIPASG
ncbi:MAG: Validoxylamine A 7'-phosphate phosphatase [Phycisphaerae bacterium]|nr:Validoxylamine A 7'-phosphate phosphatase [Phycisphaerae bacterium]